MDARYVGRYGGGVDFGVGGCVSSLYYESYHASMVERMMLKFRPIAPKPEASGSGCNNSTIDTTCKGGRGKRRYVRVKRNENKTKSRKSPTSPKTGEKVFGGEDTVVTLPLMPETPTKKDYSPIKNISPHVWLYLKNNNNNNNNIKKSLDDHVTLPPSETPQAVSFVTVDKVTEAKVESELGDWTEMEKDTCPRFASDDGDRVVWMNKAYKEMVSSGDDVAMVVVRKDVVWPAVFTCVVKVTCRNVMGSSTLTVPCDTWRMESGGYTWRLDVKAALCLGR